MSQVTSPIILDSTGQDISAKLQAIANAINGGTIDPLTVTQNGTYTPSGTTLGYGPVTVNVGGMAPLQYIASTGAGEYIDTGYAVNADTDLIIATVEIDSTNPAWASPYGVMEGGGVGECIFYAKNNGANNCFFCWGGPSYSADFTSYYGKLVTIRATRNLGQVYSGKSVINLTFSQSGSISTYPLYLFTTDNLGSAITDTHICKMKLYGFDIYEGSVLTRMYRPALDAVGVPGLYEFITDTFFYNQGAGAFVYPT